MSVEYLDLTDYLAIAVEITEFDLTTLTTVTNVSLADSALHAPAAGFGGVDLYPDFVDKAAVLLVRLTKNHPLPDGNKRAAWLSMRIFVSVNGWTWQTRPDIDDASRRRWAVPRITSGCRLSTSAASASAPPNARSARSGHP